jgi:large subunit ribosomal protein L11
LVFLGSKNMAEFVKKFNNDGKLKDKKGEQVSVEVTIYEDKSYNYSVSSPPLVYLLKNRRSDYKKLTPKDVRRKAREVERKEISEAELEAIARKILPSLNTDDIEKAKNIVRGTIKSFGSDFKITK